MASKIWKTFTFFDSSTMKLPMNQLQTEGSQITSICSGMRCILLGLSNGDMVGLSSKYNKVITWRAHEGKPITHTTYLESRQILVTVSMTCFSVTDDLSDVAAAFANGVVILVRGDLVHDRGSKQRVIFESNEPITGIQFAQENDLYTLYVTTTERVMTIKTSIRGHIPPPRVLETTGCALGCLTMDKATGNVLVARNDALYYYGPDGRGPCYAYEGSKSFIGSFGTYVALLLPPQNLTTNPAATSTSLRHILGTKRENTFEVSTLVILDTDLQFIAHIEAFTGGIKGDYDNAMQQYMQAVEGTQPSQVIRKFLDIQRIPNLIQYLEELHRHAEYVTTEHTTLLLNCYAKLKDVDKLESFIRSDKGQQFDLNTVISLCRQAGYFTQAVYLARQNSEVDIVMDILLEDMKKFSDGMKFLVTLEPHAVKMHRNLVRWGRLLLNEMPRETTALFIEYYSGKYVPRDELLDDESSISQPPSSGLQGYLLQLPYLGNPLSMSLSTTTAVDARVSRPVKSFPYQPPPPQSAFSIFVDHPLEFVKFLEADIVNEKTRETLPEISSTLFEMYLHHASQDAVGSDDSWRNKATGMLENNGRVLGTSEVLLLSHLCGFHDGTTLVREDQRLYFDIFRSHTSSKNTVGAMAALKKYGADDPQLYPAALTYLISNPRILEDAGDELLSILDVIEKECLMAPLQVVQILSKNGVATVRMIRKYLSGMIERERLEIQQDQGYIDGYRRDTTMRKQEIADLEGKPVVFQPSRCSFCGTSLELPAVHFLCKHSFHQRCLNVSTEAPECPTCAAGNAAIKAIRQAQEESADQIGIFKTAIDVAEGDRFATITDFFSRSVMKDRAT
ncbi:hypothetical protein H072_2719 [Dactylellina haptotyla CBS 200.50]|uniref:E3 ubiquitin-protein ligase PEP5 n=1 Tax=Dactylellina haptotyla (strain CBS 200.50) TaxID=1284197 RepID=S8AQE7_DACHA|nr:hypothetical protein H072_2719 [Dactylellina haptotyla CBS 200.50]